MTQGLRQRSPRNSGFTLIELLLVLFLMGLIAATLAVTLTSGPNRNLVREAEQLAMRLEEAANQARTSGHNFEWQPSSTGYRLVRLPMADENLSEPGVQTSLDFALPEGITAQTRKADEGSAPPPVILPARGLAGAVRITLTSPEQEVDVFSAGFSRFELSTPSPRQGSAS